MTQNQMIFAALSISLMEPMVDMISSLFAHAAHQEATCWCQKCLPTEFHLDTKELGFPGTSLAASNLEQSKTRMMPNGSQSALCLGKLC